VHEHHVGLFARQHARERAPPLNERPRLRQRRAAEDRGDRARLAQLLGQTPFEEQRELLLDVRRPGVRQRHEHALDAAVQVSAVEMQQPHHAAVRVR
jgi:hypothetical protein